MHIHINSYNHICQNEYNYCIFDNNRTRHASHWNSAPRRVFDFYGGHENCKEEPLWK